MPMVKVWNDNVHPYKEMFRDQKIEIPSKGFIEMEAGEALIFKGTFSTIVLDADGNPTAEGFKMIRIEEFTKNKPEAVKVNPLVCLACSYEAASEKDLQEHVKLSHSHQVAEIDEEAERAIAEKQKNKARAKSA